MQIVGTKCISVGTKFILWAILNSFCGQNFCGHLMQIVGKKHKLWAVDATCGHLMQNCGHLM